MLAKGNTIICYYNGPNLVSLLCNQYESQDLEF